MNKNEKDSDVMAFVYVRNTPDVKSEPATVLSNWRIMQVWNLNASGKRTLHLTGSTPKTNGRVTTELVNCEMTRMQATTQSGRVYLLAGVAGDGKMAEIAITVWLRGSSAIMKHRDVTLSYMRLRKIKQN